MKAIDLKEKTSEELTKELKALKTELLKLRLQHATGSVDNPIRIRDCRRNIARVFTVIKMREIVEANGAR